MRFLLRVDSHARNHSAHPQAQSQVAALRAYPAARSARAFQRRAPSVLCSSATASSAAPAGISSEFTASYLRLPSSSGRALTSAGATSAIGTILQV